MMTTLWRKSPAQSASLVIAISFCGSLIPHISDTFCEGVAVFDSSIFFKCTLFRNGSTTQRKSFKIEIKAVDFCSPAVVHGSRRHVHYVATIDMAQYAHVDPS